MGCHLHISCSKKYAMDTLCPLWQSKSILRHIFVEYIFIEFKILEVNTVHFLMNAAVSTSFESKTQLNVSMFSHWMCCSLKKWSMCCMLEPINCYTLSWLFEIWLILVHIYIYLLSTTFHVFIIILSSSSWARKCRKLDQDTLMSGESSTASLGRALLIYSSPVDLVYTLNMCVCMLREPASVTYRVFMYIFPLNCNTILCTWNVHPFTPFNLMHYWLE